MELTKQQFTEDLRKSLTQNFAKTTKNANDQEIYMSLARVIKGYYSKIWLEDNEYKDKTAAKQTYYFSIEFMPGRMLKSNLLNLGLLQTVRDALADIGSDLDKISENEQDMAIGNGGLGRLASCFMDSLASTGLPGNGNGIRYKYGLFKQRIIDGYQVELPDVWLTNGNPWEVRRSDKAVEVKFGGNVWMEEIGHGRYTPHFENQETILAVPYDTAMVGYENKTVNNLCLWRAELPEGSEVIHPSLDYMQDVDTLSAVLYPDDSNYSGRLLRLKQEYFFVSAGLQRIVNHYLNLGLPLPRIPEHVAVHINDTHPALCIPEFMRILIDEHEMSWESAWQLTVKTMSYTNHTIMAEAMEKWSEEMMKSLLPRIYQIIVEIDNRFAKEYIPKVGPSLVHNTRIVKDGKVHMANLSIIGSHSTNGVAKIHSDLLKDVVLHDFYIIFPERFNNKTNGIAERRWIQIANEELSGLIDETIGKSWRKDLNDLTVLKAFQDNDEILNKFEAVKFHDKERLAKLILEKNGITVNPNAIFDVQVKRLHAYKRQLLNLLHIMKLYFDIKDGNAENMVPRVFIFGAKAAPSYQYAKAIIKAINEVANMINSDTDVEDKLKVVFLENYNVSLAEQIIPSANVGEQISLASTEASGTSNMKFMLNGALTIGTLDGANIEIKDAVGDENIFIFGMNKDDVLEYYTNGRYQSTEIYNSNPILKRILNAFVDGSIPNIENEGREIFDSMTVYNDEYFVLRDFDSYVETQKRLEDYYRDRHAWNKSCLLNIANAARFSSDRTVREYAEQIWQINPR
ncbi:glycogen/starch/alpha-glucan phosphorylase [Lactovum miscens]|uniref:Alpha-1,4 glucan phosphorylase n=1 Tax=Lactovum miscens TaxID=190387 RepID=A0A841C580_9LACT|nr:glycogen/starch/alpha-glucan phosphorylase [Lactovum miscens]MBB5887504.1 starch phosphorylase [Lactovum miscens]